MHASTNLLQDCCFKKSSATDVALVGLGLYVGLRVALHIRLRVALRIGLRIGFVSDMCTMELHGAHCACAV